MFWRRSLLIGLILLALTVVNGQVSYTYGARVLGAKVHFVVVNPFASDLQITPVYVQGGVHFRTMIDAYRPIAAINGTFFNLRTKRPIGDIVIAGDHIHNGRLRTALVMYGPFAFITPIPLGANFMGKVDGLLACGPRLLTNGRITVYPYAEGFRDRRLFNPARRSAIGVTSKGKLVFAVITTPVTLTKAAKIVRALGCADAMNLDGGGSSALYCAGQFLVQPSRPLTTALMVLRVYQVQPASF